MVHFSLTLLGRDRANKISNDLEDLISTTVGVYIELFHERSLKYTYSSAHRTFSHIAHMQDQTILNKFHMVVFESIFCPQ